MGRMIVTEKDARKVADTLAAPLLKSAEEAGMESEGLASMRAAVATPVPEVDDYLSRLLKYIPAEVVAVYVTLDGVIRSAADDVPAQVWLWIVFGLLLLGTPLYLWRVAKVTKGSQLIVSTVAFAVWVFALGGAFNFLPWYRPVYGAIALTLYTFFVAIFKGDIGD